MDNEYYILENGEKIGPFSARQLMERPLEPGDLVLQPSETQGTFAFNMPEFTDYFKSEGIFYPTAKNTSSYILRLPAFIIDYLITFIACAIITSVLFPQFIAGLQPNIDPQMPTDKLLDVVKDNMLKHQAEFLIMTFSFFLIRVLYNAICESGRLQGSVGKYMLGLAVVDELGYSLTFWHALKRNLGRTVYQAGMMLVGFLIGLAYLRIIWGDRHQAFHDMFSGCYVVKKDA